MTEKRIDKIFTEYVPLPMCTVDSEGIVISASPRIDEVFLYDGIKGANVFALTGIKQDKLIEAAESGKPLIISRNDKVFKIISAPIGKKQDASIAIYFLDVTEEKKAQEKYKEEKTCIAIINVDNFDELVARTEEDKQSELIADIDKRIRAWATHMKGSLTKYKDHLYFLVFERKQLEAQERSKFVILDDVREIETQAEFPVTLSIGVGVDGYNPVQMDQYAASALDIALARGGDQAVIKRGNKISYYGGKTQSVEKSNKGKSRIIGHALQRLIDAASNVLIMGHSNPDMDSFGSALGIYALAKQRNKNSYIIVEKYNEALEVMYKTTKETGDYEIINNKKAKSLIDENSLVVVVDTHRPSITECPELLEKTTKVVVIDHHRKAEESIESPTLGYTESYASSTSELVTEILQYTVSRKSVKKLEADALLAGITVDTNRFSVKTGVRTFEAAAWLKRAGADTADVKKFFQTNIDTFRTRANCIANAQIDNNGIAYSICEGLNFNSQIINSQVADELLTIRGVKASFVAGQDQNGKTIISARSIEHVNVQIIMEGFGGGGHLNTAGAQVDIEPIEAIEKIKEVMEINE